MANCNLLTEKKSRKWLSATGKEKYLDFSDEEIIKLKECFGALDDDGGGSIGIDELEKPLVGLGIYNNREEIENLIASIDDDGEIEFHEFCDIIKNSEKNLETQFLNKFFKDLSSGALGGKELSFNMVYSNIRRKYMLNRFIGEDQDKREHGLKIIENVEE